MSYSFKSNPIVHGVGYSLLVGENANKSFIYFLKKLAYFHSQLLLPTAYCPCWFFSFENMIGIMLQNEMDTLKISSALTRIKILLLPEDTTSQK